MYKFLDFLLESDSKNKNSAILYYSDRFRGLIKRVGSPDDPELYKISQCFLYAERSNSLDITFIDTSDENDTITFLQVGRARRWNQDSTDSEFGSWIDDQFRNKEGEVWKKQRGEMKIGRLARRICMICGKKVTDQGVERFVNAFKSCFDFTQGIEDRMKMVQGEEIKRFYDVDNYAFKNQKGQLSSSCMRYSNCQDYFDIYTKNPQSVSLLVLSMDTNFDKILGRALVWETKQGTYLDRIYTHFDADMEVFKKYAEKRGWITPNKLSRSQEITVQLQEWMFKKYPFLDSFLCLDIKNGILSNIEDRWPNEGWYKLQCTDGSFYSDQFVWSNYSDDHIDKRHAVYCVGADDWVYKEDATYLEYKNAYATPDEEVMWSSYHKGHFYSNDLFFSKCMGDAILKSESITITGSNGKPDVLPRGLEDILIEIDGRKVLPSFAYKDPQSGNWLTKDSVNSTISFKGGGLMTDSDFYDHIIGFRVNDLISKKLSIIQIKLTHLSGEIVNTDMVFDLLKLIIVCYPPSKRLCGVTMTPGDVYSTILKGNLTNASVLKDPDYPVEFIRSVRSRIRSRIFVKYAINDSSYQIASSSDLILFDILSSLDLIQKWFSM